MADLDIDDADLDFPDTMLKALYDYTYEDDDGQKVTMKQGEEYLLLQKYDDWWEVIRKDADVNELAFFVPSNYVEVINSDDTVDTGLKESVETKSGNDLESNDEVQQDLTESQSNQVQGNENVNKSMAANALNENINKSMAANAQHLEPEPDYENFEDFMVTGASGIVSKNPGLLRRSFSDEGDYVNLDKYREEAGITEDTGGNTADSLYANLDELHQSQPHIPEYGEYIKTLLDVWDMYIHPETKRTFYVNRETNERTYKPPRHPNKSLQAEELDKKMRLKPKPVPAVKIQRKSDSVPDGWTVEEVGDEKYFINELNNEKWAQSILKENGKTYFYKVGGNETVWELPKIGSEPNSNGDLSPTDNISELDSKVMRSRPPNLQERIKSRSMYLESHLNFSNPMGIPKSATLPVNMVGVTNAGDRPSQQLPSPTQPQQLLAQQEPLTGILKVRKIVENSKKIKKNWSHSYIVLAKTNVIFYKDKRAAISQPGSPYGKPEFIVPLQDAQISMIAKDSSSKKAVVRLSARTGDQFILQHDDEKTLKIWLMQLELAVADLGSSGMALEQSIFRSTSQDDSRSEPKRKPSFKLFHTRNPSTSSSPGDDASLERRKRVWDKLSNFMARRPSKDVLEQKGIIRDAVFGAHLKQVCEKDKCKVPKFITRVIEAIEKRGLDHDGMYRVSGNLATIQKIRCKVDQDDYNLDSEEWDIHALTGSLKLFFRELKEPLFPFVFFDKFIRAMTIPQSSDRLKAMKELINSVPKCNYETMKVLFIHLLKVIDLSKENRMQVHNIAIVFGPTLIWPEKETPNLAAHMIYQSRIVEFLLLEFKNIFKS